MKFNVPTNLSATEISSKFKNILEFIDPTDTEAKTFFLSQLESTWKSPEHLHFTKQLLAHFNFENELCDQFKLEFTELFENAEDSGLSFTRLTHLLEVHADFLELDEICEKAYYHWSTLDFGILLKKIKHKISFVPKIHDIRGSEDTKRLHRQMHNNLLMYLIVMETENVKPYKQQILHCLTIQDSPSQRKRAQFLLTKMVPEIIRDRLFLVFETLEETEGHIIRQIFPHVKKLLEINSKNNFIFKDYIYQVFKRMFTHDNHKIIVDAVQLSLVLEGKYFWKELVYLLFDHVKMQSLYADVDAENSWNVEVMPKTAVLLQHFCETLDFKGLGLNPGKFILDVLIGEKIETSWSFIALAYVCQGMLKIPFENIEKWPVEVSRLYSLNMKCLNYADPIIRVALEDWIFSLVTRFLEVKKGLEFANCVGFLFSNYIKTQSKTADYSEFINSKIIETSPENTNFTFGGILLETGISKVFQNTKVADDSIDTLSNDIVDSMKKPYYDQEKLAFAINNLYFVIEFKMTSRKVIISPDHLGKILTTQFGNAALCDVETFEKFACLVEWLVFKEEGFGETFKIADNFCKTENVFDHCRLCRLNLNKIKLEKIVRQTDFETLENQKTNFRQLFRYQKLAYGIEIGMDMWNSLEDLKTGLYNPKFKDFEIETFCSSAKEFYEFPEFWQAWIEKGGLRDGIMQKVEPNPENIVKVYELFSTHQKDFICGTIIEWICDNVRSLTEDLVKSVLMHYLRTTQVVYTKAQTMNKVAQKFAWTNSLSGEAPCVEVDKSKSVYISEFYAWSRISSLAVMKIVQYSVENENNVGDGNMVTYLLDLDLNVIKPDDDWSKRRYHQNSQMHRVKMKMWNSLFLISHLKPELFTTENITILLETFQWAQDASVRVVQEWILAIILNSTESQEIKTQIYQSADKSLSNPNQQRGDANNISSFMLVLLFDALWESNSNFNVDKFKKCVSYCTVWSSYPHFPVRLLAQTVIWRIGVESQLKNVDMGADFVKMHQFIEKSYIGNQGKHLLKAKKSFSVGELMPKEDISLEVIFETIPEICGVSPTEKPKYFETDQIFIKIAKSLNEDSRKINTHLPKNSAMLEAIPLTESFNIHDWSNLDTGHSNDSEIQNVQKKIIPDPAGFGISANSRKTVGELIVIASLIDKPENLGGICRTCEALGATRLYVPNMRIVQNKEFKALSMSSHQWMEISECRFDEKAKGADKYDEIEKLLHDFKYKEGFKIIGLEQTSESQRLGAEGTTFSEKSVILLGAEKTGIPVELLTCLDQCVEIPQAGVTRSLNVHVSAAIFMWDYVRQELDKI